MSNRNFKRILDQFKNPEIKFAYIDLFCGAGGTSTGVNRTKKAVVIACVNHDPNAIASHAHNHPNALHFIEDIRDLNLSSIIKLVKEIRRLYPHVKIVLWASLECIEFSKAKGGLAKNQDSRTLALHLFRYMLAIRPDYIQIENVVEFMAWGPLKAKIYTTEEGFEYCQFERKLVFEPVIGEDGLYVLDSLGNVEGEYTERNVFNGVPDSMKNGKDWLRWRATMDKYGNYTNDWKELCAADFGGFTIRNRLFGVFASKGMPIVWPKPTHTKKPGKADLFGPPLKKWKAVRECLDLFNEGKSIFDRKKPHAEATLERLYSGLVKFVTNGDTSFISKHYSGKPEDKNVSLDLPGPSITTKPHESLVQVILNSKESLPQGNSVTAEFIAKYYGKGSNVSSINEPSGALTTKDRMALVFIDQQYGNSLPSSVELPAGTITGNPKLNAVFVERKLPFKRSTTKHHYLINPQYSSKGGSIEDPAFTLIARMDKAPPYIATAETGEAVIIIYHDDSPAMKKIKLLMAAYGIVDIKMRMLMIIELLRIQGFGDDYQLTGNQTEQKRQIGNAVVPQVVEAWVNAMYEKEVCLQLAA